MEVLQLANERWSRKVGEGQQMSLFISGNMGLRGGRKRDINISGRCRLL